ncbi:MAG: hypothetical protein HY303_13390 [Candidatus Wallbacteria bacterium]|nr:hypothetical protein [Candidatus Wallbacteria bacterium]
MNVQPLRRRIQSSGIILLAALLAAVQLFAQDPSFDGLNGAKASKPDRPPAAANRRSNSAARDRRACMGVQRTIAGAIEMYNLDQNTKVDRLDDELFAKLIQGGYLQEKPEDPGWGGESASHYIFSPDGKVVCRAHGSNLDEPLTEAQVCYAVEKLITDAIVMYNEDNNTRIDLVDLALLQRLVQKRYLDQFPRHPGSGTDSSTPYSLTPRGDAITCRFHGSAYEGEPTEKRQCLANQRTLAGAIEMYNLDFNTKTERIDSELLAKLVKGGYLQRAFDDPGQGPGSSSHYVLTQSGSGISCTVHGSSDR